MEDVAALVKLAELCDMPHLLAWCEVDLCKKAKYFHFCGKWFHYVPPDMQRLWGDPDQTDIWSATVWLAFSERLGMERLMAACVTVVVAGLDSENFDRIGLAGIGKLIETHNLTARSALCIAVAYRSAIPHPGTYETLSGALIHHDFIRWSEHVGDIDSKLCPWMPKI